MKKLSCRLVVHFLHVVANRQAGQVADTDLISSNSDSIRFEVITESIARNIAHAGAISEGNLLCGRGEMERHKDGVFTDGKRFNRV